MVSPPSSYSSASSGRHWGRNLRHAVIIGSRSGAWLRWYLAVPQPLGVDSCIFLNLVPSAPRSLVCSELFGQACHDRSWILPCIGWAPFPVLNDERRRVPPEQAGSSRRPPSIVDVEAKACATLKFFSMMSRGLPIGPKCLKPSRQSRRARSCLLAVRVHWRFRSFALAALRMAPVRLPFCAAPTPMQSYSGSAPVAYKERLRQAPLLWKRGSASMPKMGSYGTR